MDYKLPSHPNANTCGNNWYRMYIHLVSQQFFLQKDSFKVVRSATVIYGFSLTKSTPFLMFFFKVSLAVAIIFSSASVNKPNG